MREEERQKRAEEREMFKKLKVWEKTTAASRIHRIQRFKDEDLLQDKTQKDASVFLGPGAATMGRDPHSRREKENIADFVAKKREMFLVQMSLDVKKAEIFKLDDKARMKEEALRKSGQMLDEDITRFDRFLQGNDAKAHRAMKHAEDMTKKKQEKLQRIKHLKAQISAIQSEISKHKEQKEECIKYKLFLDKLTPSEWRERQEDQKRQRRINRKIDWVQDQLGIINRKMQQELDQEESMIEQEFLERRQRGRGKKKTEQDEEREKAGELEKRRRQIRKKHRTQEQLEREYMDTLDCDSGEELPLYFQVPKHLLDIFTQLEEQNLFLIQNSQETEQQLEEIQQKYGEAKLSQGKRIEFLTQNIRETEKKREEEKVLCAELKQRISTKSGTNGTTELLKELTAKTAEVFRTCGFDSDHDPGTLQMLASIEQKLEELLANLEEAESRDPEQYQKLEREAEKARREKVRQQRVEIQTQKNEERLRQSLMRSQAPVHKKTGKQIMFRSPPLHQEKKVVRDTDDDAEAEELARKFGIYVAKDGQCGASKPEKQD